MKSVFDYSLKERLMGKKVIIYGWGGEAKSFAIRLLQNNISFDYFLNMHNENYCQPSLMNKPIISLSDCKKRKDIAILVSYQEVEKVRPILEENGILQFLIEIEQFQPVLKSANRVVIYGTGSRAAAFFGEVQNKLKVCCFADSYKKGMFRGKDIISPVEVAGLSEDVAVVIASVHTMEIYNILIQNNIDSQRIFFIEYQLMVTARGLQWRYPLHSFHYAVLDADVRNKKVIIYGVKEVAYEMKRMLEILDLCIDKVIFRDSLEEDGSILQLMYEDMSNHVCIIVDHYSEITQRALEQMEIADNRYIWLERHHWFWVANKEEKCDCFLDPHLGHAHVRGKEKYPGFINHEWSSRRDSKKIRILALGGSTTSAFRVRQTSWCQYLSECMKADEISHVIYNGGVESYQVTQELIKLIRDGIRLKPDIVISYSGVNNMKESAFNSAVSDYQEILFKSIAPKFNSNIDGLGKVEKVNWGIKSELSEFEYWFSQIKMQKAICDSMGIKYFSFLQPTLYTKKINSNEDLDLDSAAYIGYLYDEGKEEFICTDMVEKKRRTACNIKKEFRKKGKEIVEEWFLDLSGFFDNTKNVYMDDDHIYAWANRKLAEKIYQKIKESIEIMLN